MTGSVGGIIASERPVGQAIVDIAPTDVAFQSSGCSDWIVIPGVDLQKTVGDGEWEVNTHIQPGRWSASGGNRCYWARTASFSHTAESIIASDYATGHPVIDILPTDVGFTTKGCGIWTKAENHAIPGTR
jgi:hypothetical protein